MAKEKCDCGKMATYLYMPGFGNKVNPYVCDDCISSPDDIGCSCNFHYATGEYAEQPEGVEGKDWRWVVHEGNDHMVKITKEDGIWVNLDDRGRPYACAEYDYSEEGYDVPTIWSNLKQTISWNWFLLKEKCYRWWKRHVIDEAPKDLDI